MRYPQKHTYEYESLLKKKEKASLDQFNLQRKDFISSNKKQF